MAGRDEYDPTNGAHDISGDPHPANGPGYGSPLPPQPSPGFSYPAPGATYPAPGQGHATMGAPAPGSPGPQWSPAPQWPPAPRPAAHKPGAVPLRPLRLGDILDAAIRIVRFNPGATVGAALLFGAVPLLVPTVLTAALVPTIDIETSDVDSENVVLLISLGVAWGVALLLQWLGVMFVTGMTAQVAHASALGQKMSLGQAWRATRGARWRLVGLSALLLFLMAAGMLLYGVASVAVVMTANVTAIVVWFLLTVPLGTMLMVWFWVKFYLFAIPALMVERTGVLESLNRSSRLVSGHFWRVLGISALTVIIAQIAATMVSFPLSLLGELASFMGTTDTVEMIAMVTTQVLSQVVATALVTPFLSAVTALLYIDVRIRKEAFDVELLTRSGAGATAP